MTEEVNVGMGAPAPKKGMSKGCLAAIIVGVILILLIGSLIWVAMDNPTDIAKFGISMTLNSSKKMLVENQVQGVDTVIYNKIVDDFIAKMSVDTIEKTPELDSIRLAELVNVLTISQSLVTDGDIDSSDVTNILQALIAKYPDIAPEIPETEVVDSLITE